MGGFRAATALVRGLRDLVRGPRRRPAESAPSATPDPAPFDDLITRIDRYGAAWVRETAPVLHPLLPTDWAPLGGLIPDGTWWTAPTDDPGWVSPPLALPAGTHWRYLHVRFAATAPDGVARTQLFRDDGDGFQESSSVSWQIVADGVERTYVIDLTAHTLPANRVPQRLRLDPLDRPGRLRLARLTLIADLAQVEPGSNLRTIMAERYLRGGGVECGALQNPMTVPATARVIYVDRLTLADARAHYPELDGQTLTPPNLVADLQRLPIGDGRVDFCIGNHLLEHARDPIGGLCQFLRTLRPGGVAFVSVPDVSNPLDRGRPVTPFTHILEDHRPNTDRRAEDARHYDECVTAAHPELSGDALHELIERFRAQDYSIHFHTFDEASFRELIGHAGALVGAVVEEYARNRTPDFDEYIAVIRRLDTGGALPPA